MQRKHTIRGAALALAALAALAVTSAAPFFVNVTAITSTETRSASTSTACTTSLKR